MFEVLKNRSVRRLAFECHRPAGRRQDRVPNRTARPRQSRKVRSVGEGLSECDWPTVPDAGSSTDRSDLRGGDKSTQGPRHQARQGNRHNSSKQQDGQISKFDAADYLKHPVSVATYSPRPSRPTIPLYLHGARHSARAKASPASRKPPDCRGRASTRPSRRYRGRSSRRFAR